MIKKQFLFGSWILLHYLLALCESQGCAPGSKRPYRTDLTKFYYCLPHTRQYTIMTCHDKSVYNPQLQKCVYNKPANLVNKQSGEVWSQPPRQQQQQQHQRPQSCGRRTSKGISHGVKIHKVIGGHSVDITSYPWQVSLRRKNGGIFCGGSIITDQHILTAAHCFNLDKPQESAVRVGHTHKNGKAEMYRIVKYYGHEKYSKKLNGAPHDIAILVLDRKLMFSPSVQPICLPRPREDVFSSSCYSTGWGKTERSDDSNTLLAVRIPTLTHSDCVSQFEEGEVTDGMLCAGRRGKDTCQGDSGGPLACSKGDLYTLYGITSWGEGCGEKPGVYTKVSMYLNWIDEKIRQSSKRRPAPIKFLRNKGLRINLDSNEGGEEEEGQKSQSYEDYVENLSQAPSEYDEYNGEDESQYLEEVPFGDNQEQTSDEENGNYQKQNAEDFGQRYVDLKEIIGGVRKKMYKEAQEDLDQVHLDLLGQQKKFDEDSQGQTDEDLSQEYIDLKEIIRKKVDKEGQVTDDSSQEYVEEETGQQKKEKESSEELDELVGGKKNKTEEQIKDETTDLNELGFKNETFEEEKDDSLKETVEEDKIIKLNETVNVVSNETEVKSDEDVSGEKELFSNKINVNVSSGLGEEENMRQFLEDTIKRVTGYKDKTIEINEPVNKTGTVTQVEEKIEEIKTIKATQEPVTNDAAVDKTTEKAISP